MRGIMVTLIAGLLVAQISRGQGTTYVSNLGQASTGIYAVGSDSWLAIGFGTGNNADGYLLDSVQLAMANASGSPSGFTAMVYTLGGGGTIALPGSSIGTLSGPTDPSTAGIYTYAPASHLTLSPSTDYFIVLTAATAIANGAYDWSLAGTFSYNPSGGWGVFNDEGRIGSFLSGQNGSSWSASHQGNLQFAITAEPIPEPSSSLLFLLGSGVFIYVRRTFHR